MSKGEDKREPPTMTNPRDLMRARHPDLFSDSEVDTSRQLPKAVFDYHLDTLTSRKQEYEFEHFCRKLAEKEICPNLRVQTGPTGGGDSKVDTETYPVAEEIAERWWVGEQGAAKERWAFAFSAKEEWKGKVKADVKNILSANRDYKRIFFFTNQFARDKDRAGLEDELSKLAKVPVTIFDRAWIVEKVYGNGHLDLAITTLGIEGAGSQSERRAGPRDTARAAELEELDKLVTDQDRYKEARFQLVEDCLRSAILARGLERPRNEVEMRFATAARLAKEVGLTQQQMRVAYNRAWTAYWWYEDYAGFNDFYAEVEGHLQGSTDADDIERLSNLWQLLPPSVGTGRMSEGDAKLQERGVRLEALLKPVAEDPARLNNALQARTTLALMKLTEYMFAGKRGSEVDEVWADFSKILDESANLGMYPVERLADLLQEFGEHVEGAAFDALYEKAVEAMRKRRSDGEAGERYTQRAAQKLDHDKPYDAIRLFGLAEELLVKEEYRSELVMALAGSSYAYERVGLLWAARNKILVALDRSFQVFAHTGEMIPAALLSLQRLAWIELQIGRVPHVLEAMSLAAFVLAHMKNPERRQERYMEQAQMQEAILGIHILNTPFEALTGITRLPDALERIGLPNARLASLFALGQIERIREEGYVADMDDAAVQTFFERWHDQPAKDDIPPYPLLVAGATTSLRSVILGTEFIIEAPNDATAFGIAESLLGALEAFIATSNEEDIVPHSERITLALVPSDAVNEPAIEFPESGGARASISYPRSLSFPNADAIHRWVEWIRDAVVELTRRQFIVLGGKAWIERVAGEERAFSRALMLGDILTVTRNIFGSSPRIRLSDWYETTDRAYARLRSEPWRKAQVACAGKDLKFGEGEAPAELRDRSQLKHTQRRVISPIDTLLWNQAHWRAVAFIHDDEHPPALGLTFENGKAGEEIFEGWKKRFGDVDTNDELGISIITGISKQNPTHYAAVVGPGPAYYRGRSDSGPMYLVSVSRINRLEPTSLENLERFIAHYKKWGAYYLLPAEMGSEPKVLRGSLVKRHIKVRQAWEIGENDPDVMALHDDDDPIIPDGVTDPPVRKALERLRAIRRTRGGEGEDSGGHC